MIAAGLILLAVGASDIVRTSLAGRARWIVLAGLGLVLLVLAAGLDSAVWWFVAVAAAAGWIVTMPTDGRGRASVWPAAALAVLAAGAVAFDAHSAVPPLLEWWPTRPPLGAISLGAATLIFGSFVFLIESGNVIVRATLNRADADDAAEAHAVPASAPSGGHASGAPVGRPLKGGRIIGPLERILVFALSLASAFTLLAAILAAKGIVRFPEISKDEKGGNAAEYFLVGSLVSWVTALVPAMLVWWGSLT